MSAQINLRDSQGKSVSMNLNMDMYKRAAENKTSPRLEVRKMAAEQGVAWDPAKGDLLDQLYGNSGLFRSKSGAPAMSMKDLGKQELATEFRAPGGEGPVDAGARLLFPQLILDTLREDALRDDGSDIIRQWNDLVAITHNVNGKRADQPIIDTSAPEGSRSGRIAQLAEPEVMVSITTGSKSHSIPTNSIGLLISDEAQDVTTVDLVRIVMEAESRGERIRRIEEQLKAMVLGDDDLDIDALPTTKANVFDATISGAGVITKKAYIKWLLHNRNKANLTRVLTGVDEALLVDDALTSNKNADPGKIVSPFSGVNLNLPTPEFLTFDQDVFGANVLVALDPRYAIQRFVNINASYEAIESYVMRKATGFRVDYGEMATRLYDGAWSVLELTD